MTSNLIEQVWPIPATYSGKDVYGLELEIEDQNLEMRPPKGWQGVADGSLRNNGLEYITSPPLELSSIPKALETLFAKIKFTNKSYSDRTSVHVHCNMQGMTIDQVKSFCLLYIVLERAFFNFVAQERFENVFCVPLMDFAAPFTLFQALDKRDVRRWSKYSALNLLPLLELGTLEFRHMHGTNDVKHIVNWVTAIDCLKQASRKKTFEEWRKQVTALNTTSEYGVFAVEVFGSFEDVFFGQTSFELYKELMYDNVIRAKLWEYEERLDKAKKPQKVQTSAGIFAQVPQRAQATMGVRGKHHFRLTAWDYRVGDSPLTTAQIEEVRRNYADALERAGFAEERKTVLMSQMQEQLNITQAHNLGMVSQQEWDSHIATLEAARGRVTINWHDLAFNSQTVGVNPDENEQGL